MSNQLNINYENHLVTFKATEAEKAEIVILKIIETDHPKLKDFIGVDFPIKQIKGLGQADFRNLHLLTQNQNLEGFLQVAWDLYFLS